MKKSELVESLALVGAFYELSPELQEEIEIMVKDLADNERNVEAKEAKALAGRVGKHLNKKYTDLISEVYSQVKILEEDGKVEAVEPPQAKETKKENSVKKPVVKKTEKVEPKKTVVKKSETSVKKEEEKPQETKETKPTKVTKSKKMEVEYLETFPKEFYSETIGATLRVRDDLKTIGDVAVAFNNDADLIVATYWTKKLLKQHASGYDPLNINPNKPKEFEHDLDLIELTFANELVTTGTSLYSYVPQVLLPNDFEADETGMRYANGCEFEVYEVVAEAE